MRLLSTITKSTHKCHRLFQDLQIRKRINQSKFDIVDKQLYLKNDIIINNMIVIC